MSDQSPLYEVFATPFRGRILRATAEIPAGTLLFDERPILATRSDTPWDMDEILEALK